MAVTEWKMLKCLCPEQNLSYLSCTRFCCDLKCFVEMKDKMLESVGKISFVLS